MGVPAGTAGRSRSRQLARDMVNLRGREAVRFVFFAAAGKNREKASKFPDARTLLNSLN